MAKYQFHKDHTEPTNNKAVFVFGSNLAARHGGGAALLAAQKYGASPSVPEGISGLSYAIPTKSKHIETLALSTIKKSVERFIAYAVDNPKIEFFMTRIGCVLAGYKDEEIAPMFLGSPSNVIFPEEWEKFVAVESEKVLVLRTVDKDGKAHGGFQWPETGKVVCPDWIANKSCGNGLHGITFPDGGFNHIKGYGIDEKWQVVSVDKDTMIDLNGKVKFPSCEVVYTGNMAVAITIAAQAWHKEIAEEMKAIKAAKDTIIASGFESKAASGFESKAASSGNSSKAASSGNSSKAASSGNFSTAASSGNYSKAASSGNYSKAASSGNFSTAASSGNYSTAASSGNSSKAASSGNSSKAASSGNFSTAASSGNSSTAASSGNSSTAASSGDFSTAASSGNSSTAASSGNSSKAASSGNSSKAEAKGKMTVAMVAGIGGYASAGIGGAFALAWKDGEQMRIAVGIVGEAGILPDTLYIVKNGKITKY